ncbi:MAG: hypothetical protein LBS60_05275 [Deltaproteobacteria bacterium]|nr:hypothetical protein [Deltaproteobacteria bacterium]
MKFPCPHCGSHNTIIGSPMLAHVKPPILKKIAFGLARLTQPLISKPIIGQKTIYCRDCGRVMTFFFN